MLNAGERFSGKNSLLVLRMFKGCYTERKGKRMFAESNKQRN